MPKEFKNKISERIYKKAAERSISIYELCKRRGYGEGNLSTAATRPTSYRSAIMLTEFAEELGTTVEYFTKGIEPDLEKFIQKTIGERDEWKSKYEKLNKKVKDLKK